MKNTMENLVMESFGLFNAELRNGSASMPLRGEYLGPAAIAVFLQNK